MHSLAMPDPRRERYPLVDRLETHITSYSVHLTVALIALPSLIWHISSARNYDDYGMPDDWAETFNKTHFTGGRGSLWGFLFAVVPIDCVHALLALDYYHGRRYERGPGNDGTDASEAQNRRHRASASMHTTHHSSDIGAYAFAPATAVPLPTLPPKTYHPLLSPLFPPGLRLALNTLYDVIISTFLFMHIINFFHVLDTNWDACDTYTSPYPENFLDPMNTSMSVLERCQRICTDMYVSGGCDVALCAILLAVHVWHLGLRAWELGMFGVDQDNMAVADRESMGVVDGSEESSRHANGCGLGEGVQSTALRYLDWGSEGRRRSARSSAREGGERRRDRPSSVESAKWSEVLLECLVP